MTPAEQADHQAGQDRVLADDGLADLGADGFERAPHIGVQGLVSGGLVFGGHWVRTSPSRASMSCPSATSAASSRGAGPYRMSLTAPGSRPVSAATAAQTAPASASPGSASRAVIRCRAASRSTSAARPRDRRDRYS